VTISENNNILIKDWIRPLQKSLTIETENKFTFSFFKIFIILLNFMTKFLLLFSFLAFNNFFLISDLFTRILLRNIF